MTIAKEKKSRRDFLSQNMIGITSVGLSGMAANLLGAQADQKPASPSFGKMIQRRLGKTGITLPIVSIGAMNSDSAGLYKRAYEIGIRHFDTAAGYMGGRSEEILGNVFKELGARDKVVISTKVHMEVKPDSASDMKQNFMSTFEGCLKRLQMDYVDILYFHGGSTAEQLNNPTVLEIFSNLKKQGKTRFVGMSSHAGQAAVLNDMARTGLWDVALIGYNFTQAQDAAVSAAIANAAAKGVGIIAMKTQTGGRRRPGEETGATPLNQAAMLKWVLRHEEITTAIPGITSFDQIDADMKIAYSLDYTSDEQKFLADKNVQAQIGFCRQCQECVAYCPQAVDIPTLMRTHMYTTQYGNYRHARYTLDSIPAKSGLGVCGSCPECTAQCRNSINIAGRIDELKSIYIA
jgi:uncharacterized protein